MLQVFRVICFISSLTNCAKCRKAYLNDSRDYSELPPFKWHRF